MSETALLLAVRNTIRSQCGYNEKECDIEFEAEMLPASVGQKYATVLTAGWSGGPNNVSSGGVIDEVFSVKVNIVLRAPSTPADKTRNLLVDAIAGLNSQLRKIIAAIHFSYPVMNAANSLIEDSPQKFTEPLKFSSVGPTTAVNSDVFLAKLGEKMAGVQRSVIFSGARRMQYQTTQV